MKCGMKFNRHFTNFNTCNVEVWKWLCNFILHLIMDVITYPCWDIKWILVNKRDCWPRQNFQYQQTLTTINFIYWWDLPEDVKQTVELLVNINASMIVWCDYKAWFFTAMYFTGYFTVIASLVLCAESPLGTSEPPALGISGMGL